MSELLKINVNEHTERKNGLTYLSWAWAWAEVLKLDPCAEFENVEFDQPDGTVSPCIYVGKETALVKVITTIKGKKRACTLPVMDHRNKPIPQPDAFAINTAQMRCLVKSIALHGLGLYIYAGEDLPEEDKEATTAAANDQSKRRTGVVQDVLAASEPLGEAREDELRELALTVADDLAAYGAQAGFERIESAALDDTAKMFLWSLLDSKARSAIKAYSTQVHSKKAA